MMVTIEVTPSETAKMHRLGCLDLCKLEDHAAIVAGFHLLLASIRED
jgi:hypothetical protein